MLQDARTKGEALPVILDDPVVVLDRLLVALEQVWVSLPGT